MKSLIASAVLAAAVFASSAAQAITYTVDRSVGSALITGTIETDGTLGTLGTSNIVGYSLTLTSGGLPASPASLSLGDGGLFFIQGDSVSATATQLLYDFSKLTNNTIVFSGNASTSSASWCLVNDGGCIGQGIFRESVAYLSSGWQGVGSTPYTGIVAFASTLAPVPVPPALPLLGAGLMILGFAGRKQAKKRASA
ncbi:hypothetical protein [Pacificoceanicola onchidii]|uniref:hypothetical protein n=1 Tax=Pacificoceanicola onchidii TaxID=2562685 RepID=UPI0010A635E7|nr:hypothetical protein [Pacificoceanicola onchidii]